MRSAVLKDISRLVVKLGTGVLTDARKQPDLAQMEQLVAQVAAQRRAGREIVLVTSGAVGAGMGVLGFETRPKELAELQACAAVGQSRLMTTYENLFAKFGLHVAQVLLTHDDLEHHERHLNARNTLVALLDRGVIPIINENDAVSWTELKFGDNDKLSALVASLLPADLLVILTTVDGVIEGFGTPDARLLPTVERIDDSVEGMAGGTLSATAVGGMAAPAAIYLALTYGSPELRVGWAIPAATDIAFAIGVLSLLGSRVPVSLKLLLTTIAIVDDMGAVAIIAIGYTDSLSVGWLLASLAVMILLWSMSKLNVRHPAVWLVGFVLLWFAVHLSGVHATV
ncbi:MAG: glutamate 5-kinase, partial [Verrucomicrobia bacterium]|nr:glutamate 5-kinase [Verrucomicrobiota bacterium]